MVVAGLLYRLSWGGRLYTTDEWSNSMYLFTATSIPLMPSAYEPALRTFHTNTSINAQNQAFLDFIKLNEIDPVTAKYKSVVDSFTHVLVNPPAGPSTLNGPAQIAMAIGLTTVAARGRGHAGRIYVPVYSGGASADGRISAASALACANGAKTLVNAINALNVGARVVIFSKAAQIVRDVNGTRCGRVVDTQRRRRSSLDEDYQRVTLV